MSDLTNQFSNLLFSSDCPNLCHCAGTNPKAVAQFSYNQRWYITFGHPGFNSPANNANGYETEGLARAAIRRYSSKSYAGKVVTV